MFIHMVPVKRETYQAHNKNYELLVYQVVEDGEYRIYIANDGFGIGDIFTMSEQVVRDAKSRACVDILQSLIDIAKDDINRNEFGLY